MVGPKHRLSGRSLFTVAIAAVVLIAAVIWWFSSSPKVELSPQSYEITLALYRACNQRSERGLQQIQAKLDELRAESDADIESLSRLQQIVSDAEDSRWDKATRQTYELLQQQQSEL